MSGKNLIDQIKHYQKDIERCPDNSERMIRCIQRLYILPVKVEHLQETGVGKSVNSLRKYKGEVGDAAKALVAKWKSMVAAEESSDDSEVPSKNQQNVPPVKVEHKTKEQSSSKNKDKNSDSSKYNSDKYKDSNNKPHHNDNKFHSSSSSSKSHIKSSDSKVRDKPNDSIKPEKSSDSKARDKVNVSIKQDNSSDNKNHSKLSDGQHYSKSSYSKLSSSSSEKRSHSSISNNHESEKINSSQHNHKEHFDKKMKLEREETSPHKKHKTHHSQSKNHSSSSSNKKVIKSESEEDSSHSDASDSDSSNDNNHYTHSEEQSDVESEHSSNSDASNSNSSTDEKYKPTHKSSHHKHSSHSNDKHKSRTKHKDHKERLKNKTNHPHNKNHEKHSKNVSSPDYGELIKENEKKIKKEKHDFPVPEYIPTPISKPIKLERNEDGSIDSGSGASFADALLGMDSYSDQKKKKKSPNSSQKSSPKSSSSHSLKSDEKHRSSYKPTKLPPKPRSIDELVEPPELLLKKVKLETLDLDISSTLPEINPNYKPLPHIPEKRTAKMIMDDDAMFSLMTTKNQRTKVFSGNKVYQESVPNLFSLCIQVLYENVDAIEYTGGVPFSLLKPLLEKVNADQLYVLEHFNPYLIEETDSLWKFHCSKDFRSERRHDMESWRDLYLRCLEERERKLKALTANINQSMAKSTPVRQAKLAYVDSVVKPPRNIARKQARYGTGNGTPSKNPNKSEILSKAIVGGNTPGVSATDVVPIPPPVVRSASHHPSPAIMKKKKAPLMQKALQVMKGTRYKR